MGIFLWSSTTNAADSYSEEAVKAAYLYRFAGFVSWPPMAPPDAPFTIAVLGSPGVARELQRLLPGHLLNNRSVLVREVTGARDLGKPQILYVGAGRADFLTTVIPAAGLPGILLVTDEDGGLSSGGVLNFLTIDRRVRFEVSLTAADRAGLKISSELLGVAVRVHGGGRQSRDGCPPFYAPEVLGGGCPVRVARHSRWEPLSLSCRGMG
jgi:hypothetical protein